VGLTEETLVFDLVTGEVIEDTFVGNGQIEDFQDLLCAGLSQ